MRLDAIVKKIPANLVRKWERTGLLDKLYDHEVERMAEWFEDLSEKINKNWEEPSTRWEPTLSNIIFPLQRRVRRWRISPDISGYFRINGIKTNIRFDDMNQLAKDLTAYNGLDCEVELVQCLSYRIIEMAKMLFSLDAICKRETQ